MDDTRDFIEQTQSRAVGYNGREMTPQEMGREFLKLDIHARVDHLDRLKSEQREYSTPREAAKRLSYERELRNAHEVARKVGR